MPLMPKIQRKQPNGGTHTLVNMAHAGSSVPYNSSAVCNAALQTSTPAVRGPVVVSSSPVPVALFTAVRGAGLPAANVLPHIQALSLPVMPLGIIGSRFISPVSFPNVTSCTLPGQNPKVPVSSVTVTTTGTIPSSGLKPSGSLKQQAFGNVVLRKSTEVARSEMLNNAGCDTVPSVSSLRDIRVQMPKTSLSFFASALGQTSSANARLREDAQMRVISEIVDRVMNVPTSSDKASSSGAKVASSCGGGSLPASSRPSVSNALSRKPSRSVSSAESPVVVLRRLSISSCEVCGSVFEKPQLLCQHLLKAHGIAVTESDLRQDSPRKPEHCVCCPLRFFSKQGLGRHLQIVHGLRSMKSCIRCAEMGIADLIEHFRVKHGTPLRMMIEWRVCYLCKLNFTTVYEVEKHVISAHKDIFPSRLQFVRAVKASFRCRNRTSIQTQSNPAGRQNTGMGCSDIPGVALDVSRKRPRSVIEIDDDSCDLNTSDLQKAQDEKRKQQPCSTDAVASNKTGATLHSPVSEPLTKKARISSPVSTDRKTDRSQALQKQHPASVLERVAVLGTVSQITKKKRNGPVLVPLTEKETSGTDAASKPGCVPDVSVRLTPLNSDLSLVQPTKESNKDGMGRSHHVGLMSAVNKKRRHTLINGDTCISTQKHSDSKKVETSDGKHKRQPDSEIIVVSGTTDTTSHDHRNESTVNRKRSHSLTTNDPHSSDLSRSSSKKVQSSDGKRKRQPDSEVIVVSGTTDTMHSHGNEPLRKKSCKSNGVSTGDLNGNTPGEKADHSKSSSHRNEEPHQQHSASAVEKGALIIKEKRSSTDATSKTTGISDVSVRLMPLSASVTPLTNESAKSSANVPSKAHVSSVHIAPSASLGNKESSVEKDKGRYRFVLVYQFRITVRESSVCAFSYLN